MSNFVYDVSVVLACNRIDDYTNKSIDSVLSSIGVDLELIVIANGKMCEDIYSELSGKYAEHFNVKIIKTPIGQLAFALNLGIASSNAEFIARMDADDICHPERLRRQLDYIKEKKLDLIGSDVFLIDQSDAVVGKRVYPKGVDINTYIYKSSPFCHPSVLFKRDLIFLLRGYNAGFNSEDYDLWLRMLKANVKWDNLPDFLLYYRVHENSTQGSKLAYSEVAGLFMRELLLSNWRNRGYMTLGFIISLLKALIIYPYKRYFSKKN